MINFRVRLLQPGPPRQSQPIKLDKNNNTFRESWSLANQQLVKKNNKFLGAQNLNLDSKHFSRKQNISPASVLLFETLNITPRRYICLTQAVILSSTSNFFATIAALCNKHATSSQKYD